MRCLRSGVAAAAVALVVGLSLGACSSASAVGPGGECALASDCAEGLVCVPQSDGSRTCSSKLGSVEGVPGAASDAGTPATVTDGAASTDAIAEAGGPADAALADASLPPVRDGGTSQPPVDSGAPPVDAAPPVDSGRPPVDAGSPADAGRDQAAPPPSDASAD